MDQKGLRGSAPARIDDKSRLKVPTIFRGAFQDDKGPDVFVTSLAGDSVRIYPMAVWLDVERKLSAMPANHPSRLKFLDRVNYFGQASELDGQGRIVIAAARMDGATPRAGGAISAAAAGAGTTGHRAGSGTCLSSVPDSRP